MTGLPMSTKKDPRIRMERTYNASLDEAWSLWTTRGGFESWWGPEGFEVKVRELDLKPGGKLVYTMTAVGEAQVGFMTNAGLPLTTTATLVFSEIVPKSRLCYDSVADFIPGVKAYTVATEVQFSEVKGGVRMQIRFDRMHDEEWTQRMCAGMESQLDRLLAGPR